MAHKSAAAYAATVPLFWLRMYRVYRRNHGMSQSARMAYRFVAEDIELRRQLPREIKKASA